MRIVWLQWNEAADRGCGSRPRVLATSSEVDINSVEISRMGMCDVGIEATVGSEADAENCRGSCAIWKRNPASTRDAQLPFISRWSDRGRKHS